MWLVITDVPLEGGTTDSAKAYMCMSLVLRGAQKAPKPAGTYAPPEMLEDSVESFPA